jgi:glycosyltransferase involved in cell wall biosynthesis
MRLGGAFDRFYDASPASVKRAVRWAIRRPDRVIVQSDYWSRLVAGLGRAEGVVVVPNWVPDELIAPVARAPESCTCLFIAGSEARRKGIELVLESARRLPDVTFRIIAAPDLPLLPNLVGCGVLDHAALLDAMRAADIFVLPSSGEAMAVGLPSVATPVGAVPEIIEDGVSGYLMPVGDAEALARRIALLANDAALRRQIGLAAQHAVAAHYCETRITQRLRALYLDLNSNS